MSLLRNAVEARFDTWHEYNQELTLLAARLGLVTYSGVNELHQLVNAFALPANIIDIHGLYRARLVDISDRGLSLIDAHGTDRFLSWEDFMGLQLVPTGATVNNPMLLEQANRNWQNPL